MTIKVQGNISGTFYDISTYTLSSKQFKKVGIWANSSSSKGGWEITSSTSYKESFNYYNITRKYSESCGTYTAGDIIGTDKKYQYSYYNTPSSPSAITGYTFSSWVTTQGGSTTYEKKSVTSDFSVYAKYTARNYNIKLYENVGDTTAITTIQATYNSNTPTISSQYIPSKTGYNFLGYYDTSTTPKKYFNADGTPVDEKWTRANGISLYGHWEIITYSISYNLNQGTATNPSTYTIETEDITLNTPTRTGYSFTGWTGTELNSATQSVTITTGSTGNREYTTEWTANSYTVILDNQEATNPGTANISATYDSDMPSITAPTKTGKVFAGYYTGTNGAGDQYYGANGQSTRTWNIATDKTTLYAYWIDPVSHTLTLHLCGGTYNESTDDIIHTVNETLSYDFPTPTPTRTGYTFDGWFTNNEYSGDPINSNDIVPQVGSGNLGHYDLYAKWTINQYTISFEENGGSTVDDITQNYATTVTKPTDPTKTGYTFSGWYTNEECTAPYTFTTMPANDITLYAKWNINQYTIVFNSNGGSSVDSITQDYQSDVVQPADPTRTGYTFSGWFTDNVTFENEFTFDTMPLNGITLYAKWTPINYKITFVENDGSTVADITQGYETEITQPTDPTKTGYTFGGWFTDNNTFENEFIFDKMPLNGATLYAKWIAKTYSVTLDKQGGEGGTSSFTATYDVKTSIDAPTREGYTFNGYWTSPNGQGTQMYYGTGTAYRNWNIDSDTTLYANWTANVCNLKFILNYANSPANPNAVNVTYDQIMNLPVPTRTGYTFLGWNTNSSGTGTYYRNGEVCKITAGSDTLYAIWEVKVYNIEINLDGGSILNQNLPSSYTIETESFNLPTPTKDGWTFEGWYDGNNLYITVSFTQGVTNGDKSYTAIWTQKITIYADMTEALKQNSSYKDPHVYYWNGSGNNTWPGDSMTLVEGNLYKLEVVFATSNETAYPKSKRGSIDALIFIFYEGSSLKQTIDIIPDNSITTADNGKEYKFIIPQPNYAEAHNWKIDNIGFAQIITLTYMDGNEIKSSEEITTSDIIQHKFYEKEGYRLEGWYDNPSFTGERHENGITTSVSLTLYAHYVPADDFYLYIDAREVINGTGEGKWTPTHVYLWSQYFGSHNNGAWPGDDDANTVVNLGNGMYQIKIDASKSYDHLILNDGGTKKTEDIELSPSNVYYIINESHWDVPNGEGVEDDQICFATTEEEHLDNLMGVQKVSGTNNFRFSAALPR